MQKKKVALALSGGLDSAVAAVLLQEQGYQVTGLHAVFYRDSHQTPGQLAGIAANEQEELCHRLGYILNIPVVTIDLRSEFKHHVIDYFCHEYSQGRTPNPCIVCNQWMKFGLLMKYAFSDGNDLFATGHYAGVSFNEGHYRLYKASDETKDQSYMLYRLNSQILSRVLFPLGGLEYSAVRLRGKEYGLHEVVKESSQDVCFIPGDYGEFVSREYHFEPGEIHDGEGNTLGLHKGIGFYTIGQRHGLGLAAPVPLYVTAIDVRSNTLIVGPEDDLYRERFFVRDVSWVANGPQADRSGVDVKIRYRSAAVAAMIQREDSVVEVRPAERQRAVTPGQSAVFYAGKEVIGGGIIEC